MRDVKAGIITYFTNRLIIESTVLADKPITEQERIITIKIRNRFRIFEISSLLAIKSCTLGGYL